MKTFKFALQSFLRDWRAGELRLLILAVLIAVAAVSSVGFLVDRVNRVLERDASQMLAADLLLSSEHAIEAHFAEHAHGLGLSTALTWQFRSMLATHEKTALSGVKVVSADYPLRGELKIRAGAEAAQDIVTHGPAAGEVWLEPQLLHDLQLNIGDSIGVGMTNLIVTQWLEYEPDRRLQFLNLAPRAMFNQADLAASQLIVPGSRVQYSLLMAGSEASIKAMRAWAETQLDKGQKLRGIESVGEEVRKSLDRANQFLSLVALLTVVIACVAIALAVWRFLQRHQDGVAVMRTLGVSSAQLSVALWLEFFFVALLGSLLGVLLGFVFHYVLVYFLAPVIQTELPSVRILPAYQALVVGLCLLMSFSAPSLWPLARSSPLRVLRRESEGLSLVRLLNFGVGCAVFMLILWWYVADLKLSLIVGLGFLLTAVVFSVAAWLLVLTVAYVRARLLDRPLLRIALAGIVNRRRTTLLQVVSLATGLMIMLLLTVTRSDLLNAWQSTIPADAPNRFAINIQADQIQPLEQLFIQHGLAKPLLQPMIRGRLAQINGREVSAKDFSEERAKNLITREFNLSYLPELPEGNQIIQGHYLDQNQDEISLEQNVADMFTIKLGDQLSFDVAGQLVQAKVSSIRAVKWDTMKVNFFAIMSNSLLENQPTTWITAFNLAPDQHEFSFTLVDQFPNISLIDVSAVLTQLQSILDQVGFAVQSLFLFTLLALVVVLVAAFVSTYDERIYEAALWRCLGAQAKQLDRAQAFELFLIGLLSGVLAASGASVLSAAIARWVFELPITMNLWLWLISIGLGVLVSMLGGHLALRKVKLTPPLNVLRSAE